MKSHVSKIVAVLMLGLWGFAPVFAQMPSSYFLDGSYNRYRLNPALTPERAFFALPALGGVSMNAGLNAGLSNFIYESKSDPGRLTTFMSPEVDSREFLRNLPQNVRLNLNLDVDLLSFGFGGPDWYFWFDSRIRTKQVAGIPDNMFEFLKLGLSKGDYYISNLNITSTNFVQTSLGFQFKPVDNLSVGVSTNVLLAAAYSKLNIDCMHFELGPEKWSVTTEATATLSVPGTRIILDQEGNIEEIESDLKSNIGVSGYGLSFDLGAEYDMKDMVSGLKVSASVTDLGFLLWKNAQVLKTDNSVPVEFCGVTDGDFVDELADEAENLAQFRDTGKERVSSSLNATVRLGAEYEFPGLDWLSLGELITLRTGLNKMFEARTSVNIRAGNILDVSGSAALSNYGAGIGGELNLHPAGINLFAGAEMGVLRVNPQFIPLERCSCSANFGIRIGIGKRRI